LLARKRQLGPKAFAHDLCHSEFVLQDLSVTAKLVELFVELLAFRFLNCKLLLERSELDDFFGHRRNDATSTHLETVQYWSCGRSEARAGWGAIFWGGQQSDVLMRMEPSLSNRPRLISFEAIASIV
jgi:hypothetical protein